MNKKISRHAIKTREAPILKMFIDTLERLVAQNKVRYIRHHPIRLVTSKSKTFPVPINESQKGAPDLIIFLPGQCWLIETKAKGGKLSKEQLVWQDWFLSMARFDFYAHFVPSTPKEAGEIIDCMLRVLRD